MNAVRPWYVCTCGCVLDRHSSRIMAGHGGRTYEGCRLCSCSGFVNAQGQDFTDGSLRDLQPAASSVAA